jgi:hypothetical protein
VAPALSPASVSVPHGEVGIVLPSDLPELLKMSCGRKNSHIPGGLFEGRVRITMFQLGKAPLDTQVCIIIATFHIPEIHTIVLIM